MAILSSRAQTAEPAIKHNFRGDGGWDTGWRENRAGCPKPAAKPQELSGSILSRLIEGEVIPRLFLVHNDVQPRDCGTGPNSPHLRIGDSESFVRLILHSEPHEILAQVQALLDGGVKLERVYLDLLAPVARLLGVMWEEDRCTFTDVTLGVARLHQVLHEIGRGSTETARRATAKRRAFLTAVPGEQHTFGVSMLEEFFLHAGWHTTSEHTASEAAILRTVATQEFDLVGFSVGCKELLEPLPALIEKVCAVSKNPNVKVMVGGRMFLEQPRLAPEFGGGIIACDGVYAVQIAERLVGQSPSADAAVTLM